MTESMRAGLLAAYAGEHRDHLAALRASFDQGGADLEDAYRHAHSLKGAARAIDLPAVVDLAHDLESLLQVWWEGGATPDADGIRRARHTLDRIEDLSAAALAGTAPATPCGPAAVVATLRVESEAADRLAGSTARLLAELERLRRDEQALRALCGPLAAGNATLGARFADILRTLEERDWTLSHAAGELAEDVSRLRQVAAESLLGGFGPMLRALAAEQGKDLRYQTDGMDTLADREVLAAMAEAVRHLLRNAVAHGIETPARRMALGKDVTGSVRLRVAASGARLDIRVGDDGAGIAVERLAAEAAARGVAVPPAGADGRGDADRLRQLVFVAGLSTAAGLDTTAGRGMGMAVVRRLVDRLGGDITLRSTPGSGTEVVLAVPLSIMVQRVVLVRVRGQLYGLPALAVSRLVQVAEGAVRTLTDETLARIDGTDYALADLGAILGLVGQPDDRHGLCGVIMRLGERPFALVVDAVEDVRDLAVSPLEGPLVGDDRLAGTVTLDRGRLVVVLSPAGLRPSPAGRLLARRAARAMPQVLVVDDSPTLRSLQRAILAAQGYQVAVAADGDQALALMAARRPDVVVTDIEMPGRDGFGLLAAMRADSALASVPAVVVSSRADESVRRRAGELGAVAFVAKDGFDQERFLAAVRGALP